LKRREEKREKEDEVEDGGERDKKTDCSLSFRERIELRSLALRFF
jgi:hypothetical protein